MPSFNVQNAKALSISEGDVKTIHDSNGQLLWGAVGYSTKYEGDTEQTTLSGKNLCGMPDTATFTYRDVDITISNGEITLNGTASGTGYTVITPTNDIVMTSGSYTSSSIYQSGTVSVEGGSNVNVRNKADSTIVASSQCPLSNSNTERTFTISDDTTIVYAIYVQSGTVYTNYKTKIQIVAGSTADYDYQQFVGGIPSPNPDYPQPISVVTGTQTLTLSDGTNSEDFTVSLGSEELCKIGDNQDYIRKDGSDWKVHKAVGKYKFDGTEPVVYNSAGGFIISQANLDILFPGVSSSGPFIGYCDQFTIYNGTSTWRGEGLMGQSSSGTFWCQWSGLGSSTAACQTWLATNKPTLYTSVTPTDTVITDATLIAQLDALESWLTRYGYTSTVAGNLPIVINRTELTNERIR